MDLYTKAAELGIQTDFFDGQGFRRTTDPAALGILSARNWGIADFTALAHLIELAARLGAGGIGLKPLHALFDARPSDCSPYSPNSRLFLNALYVDVEQVPGFSADTLAGDADVL